MNPPSFICHELANHEVNLGQLSLWGFRETFDSAKSIWFCQRILIQIQNQHNCFSCFALSWMDLTTAIVSGIHSEERYWWFNDQKYWPCWIIDKVLNGLKLQNNWAEIISIFPPFWNVSHSFPIKRWSSIFTKRAGNHHYFIVHITFIRLWSFTTFPEVLLNSNCLPQVTFMNNISLISQGTTVWEYMSNIHNNLQSTEYD